MFLLINKPKGITSHDVVNKIRKFTGIKKVGHAGTLDPNATGLLIIGIKRQSTKKLGAISKNTTKTYEAEILLGEERTTDDVEGKVVNRNTNIKPSKKEVIKVLKKFTGELIQKPPIYSAIKVDGKKSYNLARKGKKVKLKPRKVIVYSIKLLAYKYPTLSIECKVSSGTYIRALARDIGKSLKTFAYLKNLKRTKIGKYSIKNAVNLESVSPNNWQELVVDLE